MDDTENKTLWTSRALADEREFVERVAPRLKIKVAINPAKAHDAFAPDLVRADKRLADLKKQTTPFFTAQRYGLSPQYAVTFNEKDYLRYKELYPGIAVYFWVKWERQSYPPKNPTITVPAMEGVWVTAFTTLASLIESGQLRLHRYRRRVNDAAGNAKASYVLDVRRLQLVGMLPGHETRHR